MPTLPSETTVAVGAREGRCGTKEKWIPGRPESHVLQRAEKAGIEELMAG